MKKEGFKNDIFLIKNKFIVIFISKYTINNIKIDDRFFNFNL